MKESRFIMSPKAKKEEQIYDDLASQENSLRK
jgi:hypothetical protein